MVGKSLVSVFHQAANSGVETAQAVDTVLPDCICESQSVRPELSPGPVDDLEMLAACTFDPNHFDENGQLTHKFVGKAFRNGMSVSRLTHLSQKDVAALCAKLASKRSKPGKPAVVSDWCQANTGDIRALRDAAGARLFCVYDTARPDNSAHADIMAAKYFSGTGADGAAQLQAARVLMKLFK